MTTLTRIIPTDNSARIQYGLMIAWVLAMIGLPIMKWTFGTEIIPGAVTFALSIQFAAVCFALYQGWGLRQTSIAFVLVAVSTWGLEFLGSSTGFPFGEYDYTDLLQPQLGHVPLLIPMAWFMMLPSAWTVAELITGKRSKLAYIAISAAAITAWDLFLDPQMVEWGFWVWDNPVGYFGIPWVNYFGWLLTGVIVTLLVRPYRLNMPLLPLLTIYGIVWFLQTVGQAIFWGQPGPALVGAVVMGTLLFWAARNYLKAVTA